MKYGMAILSGLASALFVAGCDTLGEEPVSLPHGLNHIGMSHSGQTETGEMSYYSVKTNGGSQTASGEKLTNDGHTAAHRTLPFGTKVEVTNLRNNRTAVVRINDRGPFISGRIIDVSIGVAKKLDFVGNGVAPCRIEVLSSN